MYILIDPWCQWLAIPTDLPPKARSTDYDSLLVHTDLHSPWNKSRKALYDQFVGWVAN